MANKYEQQMKEITERLEQGVKELFQSERYKDYLRTMAQFHRYSFNNTLLIAFQKPEATLVAGYQAWQKKFKRNVKKGEKGIQIIVPAPHKEKQEVEKIDPETNEPILNAEGQPEMETVEIVREGYKFGYVFDISQTDGEPLPIVEVQDLTASVENYEMFMAAIHNISPVPIRFEHIEGEGHGYYSSALKEIVIKEGMSQSQTMKTGLHEVAHAKLHDHDVMQENGIQKDRLTKEVEAESVAYAVCQYFGLDTADYSFPYISGWSSGREMKELRSSMDLIRKTAGKMIEAIKEQMKVLQQEQSKENQLEENISPMENMPDPGIGIPEMKKYGYINEEMLPVTHERAVELHHAGIAVYALHADNTETRLHTELDILDVQNKMLGVERSEWIQSRYLLDEKNTELLQESFQEVTLFGQPALFSNGRIKDVTLPEGLYAYDLRGSDNDPGMPIAIENHVGVNHAGTILTATPLEMPEQGFIRLGEELSFDGGMSTIPEYLNTAENLVINGKENRFGIYQLSENTENALLHFTHKDYLDEKGIPIEGKNYEFIYGDVLRKTDHLESIYEKFNLHHPENYKGHSLSVSDVVVLQKNGEVTAHYVNAIGYADLPEFVEQRKEMLLPTIPEEISMDTKGYHVDGHEGTWHSVEQQQIEGELFFRMEHDEFKDTVSSVIVNQTGTLVAQDLQNGFDRGAHEAIQEYFKEKGIEYELPAPFIAKYLVVNDAYGKNEERNYQEFTDLKDALDAYSKLPNKNEKEILMESSEETPSRMGLIKCKDGVDTLENIEEMSLSGKWVNAETKEAQNVAQAFLAEHTAETIKEKVSDDIYRFSAEYAKENGELTQYRESRQRNIACKEAIEESVRQNYDGMHLKPDAAKAVIEEYGLKRVEYVLASTVQLNHYDGRFSERNKEWAHTIASNEDLNGMKTDNRWVYSVTSHPAVLNGYIDLVRTEASELTKKNEIEELANAIDTFSYDFDTYEYNDSVENREEALAKLVTDISNGDTAHLKEWFQHIIEDDEASEDAQEAKHLLERLEPYTREEESVKQEEKQETEEQEQVQTGTISFFVAECIEFPTLGEYHEDLTLEEAVKAYEAIPADRMNAVKGIGFRLHDDSIYSDMDCELMAAGKVDLDTINHTDHFKNNELVQQAIQDIKKLMGDKVEIISYESPRETASAEQSEKEDAVPSAATSAETKESVEAEPPKPSPEVGKSDLIKEKLLKLQMDKLKKEKDTPQKKATKKKSDISL